MGNHGERGMTNGPSTHQTSGVGRFGLVALVLAALGGWLLAASLYFGASSPAEAGEVRGVHLRVAYPADDGWELVDVQMLLYDDGSAPFAELAHEAREGMLERFPGGIEVQPQVTGQFALLGWSWPDNTASWGYNPAGKPADLEGDAGVFRAAAQTWNDAGADFRFTGGGLTSATPGMCNGQRDGQNTVGWSDLPGSTLAATCIPASGTVNEFDIEFDGKRPWTTSDTDIAIDLASVALHEFGHALGLDHTSVRPAVMFATYSRGSLKRALHADDVEGLVELYGLAASPVPTATATATPSPIPTPTPTPIAIVEPPEQEPFRIVAPALTRQ
jgi:hypothetical protein